MEPVAPQGGPRLTGPPRPPRIQARRDGRPTAWDRLPHRPRRSSRTAWLRSRPGVGSVAAAVLVAARPRSRDTAAAAHGRPWSGSHPAIGTVDNDAARAAPGVVARPCAGSRTRPP